MADHAVGTSLCKRRPPAASSLLDLIRFRIVEDLLDGLSVVLVVHGLGPVRVLINVTGVLDEVGLRLEARHDGCRLSGLNCRSNLPHGKETRSMDGHSGIYRRRKR